MRNCDSVLARMEIGAPWQRLAARWHARQCPECRAAYRQFVELRRELRRGEPLTGARRKVWLAAADSVTADPAPRAFRPGIRWAPAGLAASLVIAAVGLWFAARWAPREPADTGPSSGGPTVHLLSGELAWSELAGVRAGLGELALELDHLTDQASLLDEEREVEALLALYSVDQGSNR